MKIAREIVASVRDMLTGLDCPDDAANDLESTVAAKLLPVREALRALEWCVEESIDGEDYASCPECGGVKWRGHKIDCPLEAALALFEED